MAEERADRMRRLFRFLEDVQRTRSEPIRRTSSYAGQDEGQVIWFHQLPEHPACQSRLRERDEPVSVVLTIDRVPDLDPPAPPGPVAVDYHDPGRRPDLMADDGAEAAGMRQWLAEWDRWAQRELAARPVREFYRQLFRARTTGQTRTEEYEVVLGLGCLSWAGGAAGKRVDRHVLSLPVKIDYDDRSGAFAVRVDEDLDALQLELHEFVDPQQISYGDRLNELEREIRHLATQPVTIGVVIDLLTRLAHLISHDGQYADELRPAGSSERPVISFAPAVIVRQRTNFGMIRVFRTIGQRLEEDGRAPAGLVPLVDPNFTPPGRPDPAPGAIVDIGEETFLPLPLNDRQLTVIRQVDSGAQTVVQGPPGTGKTHTIAALVSHLLAQGQRVLVTAHTDRALTEVRGKLPEAIKPLTVSVIGSSRSELGDLRQAVETIAKRSEEHRPERIHRLVDRHRADITRLAGERAEAYDELVEVREAETIEHTIAGRTGTLAELATQVRTERADHGWIDAFRPQFEAVTNAAALRWLGLVRAEDLARDAEEAGARLLAEDLPTPAEFTELCRDLTAAEREAERAEREVVPRWVAPVQRLGPEERDRLRQDLRELVEAYDWLAGVQSDWIPQAIGDAVNGYPEKWADLRENLGGILREVEAETSTIGDYTEVRANGDPAALQALARSVLAHVRDRGDLRCGPDGMPKTSLFTPKVIKTARPLFAGVRVDGTPPTTATALTKVLAHYQAERLLRMADREWEGIGTPAGWNLSVNRRQRWYADELERLDRVVDLGRRLAEVDRELGRRGFPPASWTHLISAREILAALEIVPVHDALERVQGAYATLFEATATDASLIGASPGIVDLHRAVRDRDPDRYAATFARNAHLIEIRRMLNERERLRPQLEAVSGGLVEAVDADPLNPVWDRRLGRIEEAMSWYAVALALSDAQPEQDGTHRERILRIERTLRRSIQELAADRAWGHALDPARIDGATRVALHNYVRAVRRLGKGTGKYAAVQRAEARDAMNRCRGAVPVWIMPIYRIIEQLPPVEDMFDVIIVDEASQADMDAVFLQYLAPRIVVVGDDRQVSPSGVGIDQQLLRDLADKHIPDIPDRHTTWADPLRSLFDEAGSRFGHRITLTEHRRCVPEIIEFSNQIAYRPHGITLEPVRQVGSSRLEPIKTVFVPDGYQTTRQENTAEAAAIVDQVEACIADPAYEGKTIGVISLLGTRQARNIEQELLRRVPPEEFQSRQIQCGDSSAFQGSERDVIFLSLVASPAGGRTVVALTRDLYVQRYNVAVSRAKDQVWLFHSVQPEDVPNPEDMRHQLLHYCLDAEARAAEIPSPPLPVPTDVQVPPFDALFEQWVFNALVERGFDVRPQIEVQGHRIDLTVCGAHRKVAVECEGDVWAGSDAYQRELARQRDLEQSGWVFLRVRGSAYAMDPVGTIEDLVHDLAAEGIEPVDWGALAPQNVPQA